jgi:cell division protease FtsH
MKKQLKELRSEFVQKVEQLENIKTILKNEFVGIDDVIDKVVDNVRSWYTMSFIQERPAVINLWGLTGVGKTSLILRLMDLIGFSDMTFRLDLGEKEGGMSFRNSLADLCENKNDAPIVIVLDEFQHARTLKGSGPFKEEIENDKNRMVWELIDSGKVSYIGWKRGLWNFEEVLMKLKKLLISGVEVKDGVVVKGHELYLKEASVRLRKDEKLLFFPEGEYDTLISLAGAELNLTLRKDVENVLLKLNGPETIDFLNKVFRVAQKPSIKNFSKALIVILGNIDEAYTMSGNYSTEISADDFHEQSLKITIPQMKAALRMRFRDEQIARLGNAHIIYPALSKKAFFDIIDLELKKINDKMIGQFGISVSFDQSVKDVLYKEGVYPTQGARPLLTTIQTVLKSRISLYLSTIIKNGLNTDHMHIQFSEGKELICEFYGNERLKHVQKDELLLQLEPLRKPKHDELQTIAAVHESGHAVLFAALMHAIPELIVSVTSDPDSVGYVYCKDRKLLLTRDETIRKVAVHLGGIAAEELVFGKDLVTSGAGSDLSSATKIIMSALKHEGMGNNMICYAKSNAEDSLHYHQVETVEDEAIILLEQAKNLAMSTLKKEKKLLLVMSAHLSEHSRMERKEIQKLIDAHMLTELPKASDAFKYRNKLKEQLKSIELEHQMGIIPLDPKQNRA